MQETLVQTSFCFPFIPWAALLSIRLSDSRYVVKQLCSLSTASGETCSSNTELVWYVFLMLQSICCM